MNLSSGACVGQLIARVLLLFKSGKGCIITNLGKGHVGQINCNSVNFDAFSVNGNGDV